MKITPFPSQESSALTRPGLCFSFQPFSTKYWTHILLEAVAAAASCDRRPHLTVHRGWWNGLSQIKFLRQSLPLLIRESGLFMRDGVDVSPCRTPAVLTSLTSCMQSGKELSAMLKEDAFKERIRPANLGPSVMHSLTHKGHLNAYSCQTPAGAPWR